MVEPSDARTIKELLQSTNVEKASFVYFWGHTQKDPNQVDHSCFSQWYSAQFEFNGTIFLTAEHFMMAEKARLFEDTDTYHRIMSAQSAAEAKALGREVEGYRDSVWERERFEIVVSGNVLKFGSNSELKDHLVGTGSRVLVEASPADSVWGIGMAADEARSVGPAEWKGLNLLGFALMEARARIARNDA